MTKSTKGFTLIEVLIALAILAIALTAILSATGNSIQGTARITQKTLAHIVATQAVTMVQLKLIPLKSDNSNTTQVTELLGQHFYWQATLIKTSDPYVGKLAIKVTSHPSSPIIEHLQAYVLMEPQ